MSDDFDKGLPPGGDPLFDPNDPAAVEREERRREREAKRAQKRAKKRQKEAAPPPPPKEVPPPVPRTPEQEFWDEPAEPPPPPPGQGPAADPEKAERGRRRLLRRRKGGASAAAAAGTTAGGAEAAEGASPPPATAPTGEAPIPPRTEAPRRPTAATPQVDPGPRTAETPRPDPNQPTGEHAFPGTAEHAVPGAGPATREHRASPPRPLEETGAGDWEPPPPRDDWFDGDDAFDDEGDPGMAGAARTGRRHGDGGHKRFGGPLGPFLRHPFRVLGVVVLIVVLLFLNAFFQPFHGEGHGKVAVKIPKGSSVGEVGELLEKKGVISGGFIISGSTMFQARVTLAGDRSDIIAGRHVLAEDMSYGDAIDALTQEPSPSGPTTVTVTIPEGYTRSQISRLAKEDGLRGNYMKATVKSKYLDPADYGGKKAKNLEGFLFPDTWELKRHRPVEELVQLQLADFKKKIKNVNMKYAKSKNLTVYDVVTIASIIEHESGVAGQRRQVASVIYNRLREGMTLGSDATVRFAVHNFTKPLTQSQLESNSPYNTRVHAGLPPGPISNPGIATINAAAHPAKGDDLFFVTSPDCKTLAFSRTEAEFERDVRKYEASKCTE
ncbi:MAG TPA: endolytic transglycosylase MltG [Solirubrobacterales bacterium]|nr:endolytic transglycosylase MltG [Solirubrobacterales bacterium]